MVGTGTLSHACSTAERRLSERQMRYRGGEVKVAGELGIRWCHPQRGLRKVIIVTLILPSPSSVSSRTANDGRSHVSW